jgi:hypothetical protein
MAGQYTEGQRLKGSDGKIYVVHGGVPVEEASVPAAPVFGHPNPRVPYEAPLAAADLAAKRQEAQIRALQLQKLQGEVNPPASDPRYDSLTGPEYLKHLSASDAAKVRALAEGRMAFPSGAGMRSPYWQQMIDHVAHYDPTFDAVNYQSRAATRKDFTAGKSAANIRALNTAIGHLGQLADAMHGTNSGPVVPLNAVGNYLESKFLGDPGPGSYTQLAGHVSEELTAVFRNSGGASQDVQRNLADLSANAAVAQKRKAFQNLAGLLQSRLDALGDQYTQGMGTTRDGLTLLNPHAQAVFGALSEGATPRERRIDPSKAIGAAGAPISPTGGGPNPPSPGSPQMPGGGSGGGGQPPLRELTVADNGPGAVLDAATGVSGPRVPLAIQRSPNGSVSVKYDDGTSANFPNDQEYRKGALLERFNGDSNDPGYVAAYKKAFGKAPDLMVDVVGGQTRPGAPQSALDTAGDQAFDGITFGNADRITAAKDALLGRGTYRGNLRQERQIMADQQAQHPIISPVANMAGGALTAGGMETGLGLTADRLATSLATRMPGLATGITERAPAWVPRIADAAYGMGTGASNAQPGQGVGGALVGGLEGMGGGMFGRGATKAAGSALTGVTNPLVQGLKAAGVPLTFGQAVSQSGTIGKIAKSIEDGMTHLPGVGNIIAARRAAGIKGFNTAAFTEGLAPIAQPPMSYTGEQGIDAARQAVGQGYRDALDGVNVSVDAPFGMDYAAAQRAGAQLPGDMADQARFSLDKRVNQSFAPGGTMDGNAIQQSLRGLGADGRKMAPLPFGHDFADVTGQAADAVEGLVNRQAPGVMPALRLANTANRNVSTLTDAVDAARNGGLSGETGLFMPSQLANAASKNARRFGGTQGTTNQPFFELTRAGQAVLPSRLADSGTATRALVGGAVMGGGTGLGYASGDTAGGAEMGGLSLLALALGGSKQAQKLLVRSVLDRPQSLKYAGNALRTAGAPIGGMFGASALPNLIGTTP